MNLQKYKEWILQPITEQNPIGEELNDDADFDFIDEQIMKIGTLSHGSIEWYKVAELSAKLLGEKSKDIRVFSALLKSINHNITPMTWIASFDFMNAFISHYWQSLHPLHVNKSASRKRQYFDQILQQLLIIADKIDYSKFDKEHQDNLNEIIQLWKKVINDVELSNTISNKLITKIELESKINFSDAKNNNKSVNTPSPVLYNAKESSIKDNNVKESDTKENDLSEKKSIRLSEDYLTEVAKKLAEDKNLIPVSITLKRHILWRDRSLPPYNAEKKTRLKPFNADRVTDYYHRLGAADLALWHQIEQSITLAPFWFEGQWLSYQVAEKLNRATWCEIILNETHSFVEKEPILSELYFSDGTPLISKKVKEWLQRPLQNQVNDWEDKWQELITLYKKEGISPALAYVNNHLQKTMEPREIAYWQWLNIKLLAENKLTFLAKKEAQALLIFISQMKIENWEPFLVKELQDHAAAK